MAPEENFRDVQYYAQLKRRFRSQHVVSKTAYGSYCTCKDCRHPWRGECMRLRCSCCTAPYTE